MKTTTSGLPIQNKTLQQPPTHIPDGNGGCYKTELALVRTPEYTEKIIWWYKDDPRKEPHNHPWDFVSSILSGGYTEDRWWIEDGVLQKITKAYRAGDENVVPSSVYHVVYDVQPGTVTNLKCGVASEGNAWGYLDLNTLEHIPAKGSPDFLEELWKINPHLRK